MPVFHFSNHNEFEEAIIGFVNYCRDANLPVGLSHTMEALIASGAGFANDYQSFKYALKALFCTQTEQHEAFDKCFDVYWGKRKHDYAPRTTKKGNTNMVKKSNSSLVLMGFNPNKRKDEKEHEEEAKNVSGSSRIESLKATDFSSLAAMDNKLLNELMEQLLKQLNHRLKRKLESTSKGKIDLRKTIRNNISNGNMLIELERKDRKKEKYRLILLLDVSGSMDKYSFFLLKFIWSLKSNLKHIEAFVFSTKLLRITDFLHRKQLDYSLWQMSQNADNWSGGTKIGECLKEFNDRYSKRILNGKSITIVLSDGLDNGETELLASELNRIKMRTSKLVWLNPLKGMRGYAPEAKGMKAALPSLDVFDSAHNLESLTRLENILADV